MKGWRVSIFLTSQYQQWQYYVAKFQKTLQTNITWGMLWVSGGGVCAGGAVRLHGRGAQRGVAARGAARWAAQGGLRRLVVRATRGYVHILTTHTISTVTVQSGMLIFVFDSPSGSRRGLGAGRLPRPAQDVALVQSLARPPARALSAAHTHTHVTTTRRSVKSTLLHRPHSPVGLANKTCLRCSPKSPIGCSSISL